MSLTAGVHAEYDSRLRAGGGGGDLGYRQSMDGGVHVLPPVRRVHRMPPPRHPPYASLTLPARRPTTEYTREQDVTLSVHACTVSNDVGSEDHDGTEHGVTAPGGAGVRARDVASLPPLTWPTLKRSSIARTPMTRCSLPPLT
ncbi:unnamed protein product [Chrysodeixis includens]|uniref:Uncharacterized protein n=1 Tax=Chrysodeixis includens TaxID=689277 RepID=A0A9N8KW43_CHRIL|nr:unnamed protein product [Chrysodeixis includens]